MGGRKEGEGEGSRRIKRHIKFVMKQSPCLIFLLVFSKGDATNDLIQ